MTTKTFKTAIGTIPKRSRFVLGFAGTGTKLGIGGFSIVAPRKTTCKKIFRLLLMPPIDYGMLQSVALTKRSNVKREKSTP